MAQDEPDFTTLIAIDPGRNKCGVASVNKSGGLLHKEVCATVRVVSVVFEMMKPNPLPLVIGDGTYSKEIEKQLRDAGIKNISVLNEKNLTERARIFYFKENPPRGLRKLIPFTLQTPPVPYDDYAAWLLARDYLNQGAVGRGQGTGKKKKRMV